MMPQPDWSPFWVIPDDQFPPSPRDIKSLEGKGDRLRSAAFAELQAREAFSWASKTCSDAPQSLKRAWIGLSMAEDRHLGWIQKRMSEIGVSLSDKPVNARLWHSFMACKTAKDFSVYIASAEERGRQAALRFVKALAPIDPETARVFETIAIEEISHIELVRKFFPGSFEAHQKSKN